MIHSQEIVLSFSGYEFALSTNERVCLLRDAILAVRQVASQAASTSKFVGKMKVTSSLLIAGGLPAVFGGSWYPTWNQCPSSAPTKPVTGDRQCDVSKAKCSSSSVCAVHLESTIFL